MQKYFSFKCINDIVDFKIERSELSSSVGHRGGKTWVSGPDSWLKGGKEEANILKAELHEGKQPKFWQKTEDTF